MQSTFLILATYGDIHPYQVCRPFELDLSSFLTDEYKEARLEALSLIIRTWDASAYSTPYPLCALKIFDGRSGVSILSIEGEELARELDRLEEEAAIAEEADSSERHRLIIESQLKEAEFIPCGSCRFPSIV